MKEDKRRRKSSSSSSSLANASPAAGGTVNVPLAIGAPSTIGPPSGDPATGAWWPAPSFGASFTHDSSPTSSEWLYPLGGFMRYLHSQYPPPPPQFVKYPSASHLPENFHFVGNPMTQSAMSPTAPPRSTAVDDRDAQKVSQEKEAIAIEYDDTIQPARSEVRLNYTHEEDVRLVSVWLHNLVDPIDGNERKSDQYWTDVTAEYNGNTESNRRRNRNQLKICFDRIKKAVTKVYQSGRSDDQIMDEALQLYASEHSDKPFTFHHAWRILRHERKWSAYLKKLSKEKENSANTIPAHIVNLEDNPKERPMGHKRAKDERNGKRKSTEAVSGITEKLDKFIEASQAARNDRENMVEVQQSLANKKLEAAKLAHKTGRERTKCKMLETYKDLLFAPTSDLSEEAKAEREKALESMRLSLFAKDD